MSSPAGLQVELQERTGLAVYNLGIPSVGPRREAFLLDAVGLGLRPRYVVWLFFGGNDVDEAHRLLQWQEKGIDTYAQLYPGFTYPRSYLADLVAAAVDRRSGTRQPEKPTPLPPFLLAPAGQPPSPIWFHPTYLRNLRRSGEDWQTHPGWAATRATLTRVSTVLEDRGIRLLLVYVPSKPQVYLPHVEENAALLRRTASFGRDLPLAETPEELWDSALRNRGSLERLLAGFAEHQAVDFLTLSALFAEAARAGTLCYLSADTHWNDVGQILAVEPIVEWLQRRPRAPPRL